MLSKIGNVTGMVISILLCPYRYGEKEITYDKENCLYNSGTGNDWSSQKSGKAGNENSCSKQLLYSPLPSCGTLFSALTNERVLC
jgi:hypothetical protein